MKNPGAKDMKAARRGGFAEPSTESREPERTAPEKIGRYELCFELASGGMASVYLARAEGSPGFQKLVALKRIHPHLSTEKDYVDMFLDEARIASHVTHPNVCSTHDFGEVDSVYYLAMEYLLGEPVFDVINRLVERFDDVREVLHDGQPTACVHDAAFAYVDAYTAHVNVGFFRGAELDDPAGLLEGGGKTMRHVKLRPEAEVDAEALGRLIRSAYSDMQRRVAAE